MTLTALSKLIKKYNIDTNNIGRLEVGTETLIDKSKSVKSVLMQLFGENTDIEGVDTVNACYGGTSAVFNAINWVESSAWDGRDAIVVAGDIALYGKGAARPTGGAGAVALLIGPDAPIVFDPIRGSHMEHVYDFYKPDFTSEYPVVDGHFSLTCYTRAVDKAYTAYNKKVARLAAGSQNGFATEGGIKRFDYSIFHVPICKQVVKSYARLLYNDYLANPKAFEGQVPAEIAAVSYEKSLTDKALEKHFMGLAKQLTKERVQPSLNVPTNTGNMYTASVYSSLSSLLSYVPQEELAGKRISFFSYGSGAAASFFSAVVKGDISNIVKNLDVKNKLASRLIRTPTEYEAGIALREKAHLQKNFEPTGDLKNIGSGVYYLTKVDEKFRRSYAIKE